MLKTKRLEVIENHLYKDGSVVVSQLSKELNVTEETIRRDLEELEKQDKLKRVHGGAFLPDTFDREVPIKIRESIYNTEKVIIATCCLNFIKNGDSILLDSSTTAIQLAKLIKESQKQITVITNSLKVSQIFENYSLIKLISLGGNLRLASNSFVGNLTTNNLEEYFVDKSFISCSGLDINFGITDNSEQEAKVRKKMLIHSSSKFLIVDHTKFDSPSVYKICNLSEIDTIITDTIVKSNWKEKLTSLGIEIVQCKQ